MAVDADVAVVGLGTLGSMTVWQLARAGADVLGFEQFGIGHDRSAAGGESRIFRTAYQEGPEYVPLLREAHRLWRELEAESGGRLLTATGGLTIGAEGTEAMANVLASIERFGLPAEVLDAAAMRWRYPQHRLADGEMAVLDHTAGVLRPEFAVIAAVTRAVSLGARVHSGTAVTAIEPFGDHVVVTAGERRFTVRQVVVAGGPWTARLVPALAGAVHVRRIVMTWFATTDPARYGPERFPVFIRQSGERHVFGIPTFDGGSVKVALVAEDPVADPDALDRDVRPSALSAISSLVQGCLPELHPYPHRVSVHMDGYTADGHPLVGAVPGVPNVVVLGGFSGHGFKMAPAIGRVAADLVLRGQGSVGFLDPGRHAGI
ncbi:N-methyl-L-tryptophan oxidase [Amycolatopsis granulosa]|uniref:N-methyl-L-tryptophan oxidase n=1 Tax=Amycolatopsis granulosa TaxID=185684 RepID=UPI0014210B5A|nr:N-methyl-L-tryptophan oxidase [Amycolatopsis granulosa]NIH84969.1 sarcosine oxidase [Amycolatopsis granulosa]